MTRRKTTPLPPRPPLTLPAHWPAYTTPRCAPRRAKIRETQRAQRGHMAEMAAREPHPHEAFFKKRS